MATVSAKVMGGSLQEKTASTVKELAEQLSVPNHQASVNGEPVDGDYELSDYEFVTFAEKVKGA
jgi:sulfur carrier protein ThiS